MNPHKRAEQLQLIHPRVKEGPFMRDIPTLILPVLKAAITLFVRVCVFMPNSYRILFSFDEFSFTLQALLLSIVLGPAPADSC